MLLVSCPKSFVTKSPKSSRPIWYVSKFVGLAGALKSWWRRIVVFAPFLSAQLSPFPALVRIPVWHFPYLNAYFERIPIRLQFFIFPAPHSLQFISISPPEPWYVSKFYLKIKWPMFWNFDYESCNFFSRSPFVQFWWRRVQFCLCFLLCKVRQHLNSWVGAGPQSGESLQMELMYVPNDSAAKYFVVCQSDCMCIAQTKYTLQACTCCKYGTAGRIVMMVRKQSCLK